MLVDYRKLIVAVAGIAGVVVLAAMQTPGIDGPTALTYISAIAGGFFGSNLLETKMKKNTQPTETPNA